jgi:hypothetical protein
MPVSPSNAAALARAVASEYEKAERVMVARIARNLAKGIDGPRWAEEKLAQLRAYRKEMVALITDLNREAKTGATTALTEAYKQGGLAAVDEMARFGTPGLEPLAGAKSLEKLLSETLGYLGSMNKRILRVSMDAYRDAVAAGVDQVLLGTMTRRQASQSVLDAFARKGVAPLFDKAGRAMNMIGYAEMAVRTGAMNASFAGHLESLQSFGMDLVIVSEDGSPCERCAPWEGEILSISGGNTQYQTVDDAMEDIGHPNCVVGGARVSGPDVCAAYSRWYEGEVVILRRAAGDAITVTPNHPILTPRGWVAAHLLNESDEVVCYLGEQNMRSVVRPDDVEMPALIEEIPGALLEPRHMLSVSVPPSSEQFHGDGFDGEVEIVHADCLLGCRAQSGSEQPIKQCPLRPVHLSDTLDASGASRPVVDSTLHPADCGMGGGALRTSLLGRSACVVAQPRLSRGDSGTALKEPPANGGLPDSEVFTDFLLGHAGLVEVDRLVSVRRRTVSCHVYNLQTVDGWFACNGIVTHNCEHTFSAYQEGVTKLYPPKTDEERAAQAQSYKDSQNLRGIERQIRAAKLQEAAAMDSAARQTAAQRVAYYQAKARDLVKSTSQVRQYAREQIGKAV